MILPDLIILRQDVISAIETEHQELDRQLEILDKGVLAQKLRGRISNASVQDMNGFGHIDISDIEWTQPSNTAPSDWPSRLQKVGNITKNLSGYVADWTTGPFAQTAKIGSATAARGSQGHQFIYNAGKFLRVNFKGWGAVKVTRYIGNAGRIIGGIVGSCMLMPNPPSNHAVWKAAKNSDPVVA